MRLLLYACGRKYLNVPDTSCRIVTIADEARFDTILAKCVQALGYQHDDVHGAQLFLLPEGARIRNRDELKDSDRIALFVASQADLNPPPAVLSAALPVLAAAGPRGSSPQTPITSDAKGTVGGEETSAIVPSFHIQCTAQESEYMASRMKSRSGGGPRGRGLQHYPGEIVTPKERFKRAVRRIMFLNRVRRMAGDQAKRLRPKRSGVAKSLDTQIKTMFNMYEYGHQRRMLDEEGEKLPCGILHPEGALKITWDIAMLCLVVFFAVVVPYRIGFDIQLTPAEETFDYVADVLFLVDIVLSFRTAFHLDGVLVSDPTQIALDYLKTWFPIDFLASFPIGWFTSGGDAGAGDINKLFRMLRLFKLFRILRLLKLFPRVMVMIESAIKLNPAMLRFLRSFVAMFLLWHFIAAAYFYMAREEYGGTTSCADTATGTTSICFINHCLCGTSDPADFQLVAGTRLGWYDPNNPDQWVPHPEVASWPPDRQYWTSLFWAVQVTTGIGNDIIPKSNMEIVFTVSMTIIGLMMYSVIIGSAASALQEMDTASTERRQKLDMVTNYLRSRKVPAFMQKIIKDYYNHMWTVPGKSTTLFDDLPPKLRQRLGVVLNQDLIDRIPILQYLPMDVFISVAPRMEPCTYLPGEFVARTGDSGDCLYFVLRGKVDAVLDDTEVFMSITPGGMFGEGPLIWGARYSASFRAVDFVDLLILSRSDYNELEASAPTFCAEVSLKAMQHRSMRIDAERALAHKKRHLLALQRAGTGEEGLSRLRLHISRVFRRVSVAPAQANAAAGQGSPSTTVTVQPEAAEPQIQGLPPPPSCGGDADSKLSRDVRLEAKATLSARS